MSEHHAGRTVDLDEGDATPITVNQFVKWAGFAAAIVSAVVSLVWFAANVNARVDNLAYRVSENEKKIDLAARHSEDQDRAIADIRAKLDVAVAILERIDKRVAIAN